MKKTSNAGFTIVELLITIAIMSILAAVVFPALSSYSKSLKRTYLNSQAKEIYLSAYVRVNTLETLSSDAGFKRAVEDLGSSNGRCYVSADQEITDFSLVSEGVINQMIGSAVLDVTDGHVNAAFYSEKYTSSELLNRVIALCADGFTVEKLNEDDIGYYGSLDAPPKQIHYNLRPKINVFNREDLFLRIQCDGIKNIDSSDLNVLLKFTDSLGASFVTDVATPIIISGEIDIPLLLDSRMSNKRSKISEYFLNTGLSLNGEITVEVSLFFVYDGEIYSSSEIWSKANAKRFEPLFDSVDGDTVYVTRARHLYNLRFLDSSIIKRVVVGRDIDLCCSDPDEYYLGMPVKTEFLPIELSGIDAFEGQWHRICGLDITSADGEAGLFSQIDFTVSNLFLYSPEIDGKISGSLAGILKDGGKVESVYVIGEEDSYVNATGELAYAGGLIGIAEIGSEIKNCATAKISVYSDGIKESYAGGLAGIIGGRVTSSSAFCRDITIRGGTECAYAGGITGKLDGVVSHCYTGERLQSYADNAVLGGIAAKGANIYNSYSTAYFGYLNGGKYYGISSDGSGENKFLYDTAGVFAIGNGGTDRVSLSAYQPEGFVSPDVYFLGGDYPFMTSVYLGTRPMYFGEWEIPEPRGAVGILKVSENQEVLVCVDCYGNDFSEIPEKMELDSGYWFFRTKDIAPNGIWYFEAGDTVFDECVEGEKFVYYSIQPDETVEAKVGINGNERTTTLEADVATESDVFGVMAVTYSVNTSWDFNAMAPVYEEEWRYNYCYFDAISDERLSCFYDPYISDNPNRLEDAECLNFDMAENETRFYIFYNSTMPDYDVNLELIEEDPPFSIGSYTFIEITDTVASVRNRQLQFTFSRDGDVFGKISLRYRNGNVSMTISG